LISCTKRTVHFLAKEELSHGLKKIIFKNMGIIFVNRKIHDKNALKNAIDVLNHDKVIGIFPEGTVSHGDVLPFKIGAVKMASSTGSFIVPFSISGKYKFRSRNLTIKFMEPIEIYKTDDLSSQNESLRELISSNRGGL
jgi:1-acyl-sn-glycerol-3-phosphate acyltransferase